MVIMTGFNIKYFYINYGFVKISFLGIRAAIECVKPHSMTAFFVSQKVDLMLKILS